MLLTLAIRMRGWKRISALLLEWDLLLSGLGPASARIRRNRLAGASSSKPDEAVASQPPCGFPTDGTGA